MLCIVREGWYPEKQQSGFRFRRRSGFRQLQLRLLNLLSAFRRPLISDNEEVTRCASQPAESPATPHAQDAPPSQRSKSDDPKPTKSDEAVQPLKDQVQLSS